MARPYHKFTQADDYLIKSKIESSPSNLTQCFKEAAEEIGVDYKSIHYRYYKKIRHSNHCFTIISANGTVSNTKIVRETTDTSILKYEDTPHSLWKRILNIFKRK